MADIFDVIERSAAKAFEGGPVCVHVGDVEMCDIKRHPLYPRFRADAVSAGVRSAASSRLWESMIAMGRISDLNDDETWLIVILDCIVPCFRNFSARISRDFRVEREELRSMMIATALEVWADTASGVPPRHVRDRMVKAAFDAAYEYARSGSAERSTDDVEIFSRPEDFAADSTLRASSILDVDIIRDPDVVEQIRGERFGALLQRLGHACVIREFHDEIRAGRRSGSVSEVVKASGLSRFRIGEPDHYYYTSDIYPSYVGLQEAVDVMGISESAAHRLIRAGQLPIPAARAGRSYKVSVRALMSFENIPDAIVYMDDVENGICHAGGGMP